MRRKFFQRHPKQRGITLILAILIMSSVVAIGITVSTITVTQVRLNEVASGSHEGYYAAESGLEQGLQKVQELKSGTIGDATTTLKVLTLPTASIASENASYFNVTDTKLAGTTSSSSAQTVPSTLKENQSTYIEIYDVDASLTALVNNLPTLCVYGQSADNVSDEVLEITWVAWTTDLQTSRSQRVEVANTAFSSSSTCSGTPLGYPVPLTQFYPAFNPGAQIAGYRVRITALKPTIGNGDVKNFSVYVDTGAQLLTNQIQLKSVSSGKSQKQALVATFPWTLPLSSIFDFVIFSERNLTKDIPLSISQEVKSYGPYNLSGCTTVGSNVTCNIPGSLSSDPLNGCVSNTCIYYVRLKATDSNGWVASGATLASPAGSQVQSIKTLSASSCILSQTYTFTTTSATFIFTNKPTGLVSYQLLTQPSFIGPEEGFCPTT